MSIINAFTSALALTSLQLSSTKALSPIQPNSHRVNLGSITRLERDTLPKVYAWSDLHLDYPSHRELLKSLASPNYKEACLILAGDLTDNFDLLADSLAHTKKLFDTVVFVPGNHELWVRDSIKTDGIGLNQKTNNPAPYTSIDKFHDILKLCDSLEIRTQPTIFETPTAELTIFPLYSWYVSRGEGEHSLSQERSFKNHPAARWADYTHCRWPDHLSGDTIDQYFDQINARHIQNYHEQTSQQTRQKHTITFSHFVPSNKLLYPTRDPDAHKKIVPKIRFDFSNVAGSNRIKQRAEELGAKLHIYGHHHRNCMREENGITYLNTALGNPREHAQLFTQPQPVEVFPRIIGEDYFLREAWENEDNASHESYDKLLIRLGQLKENKQP